MALDTPLFNIQQYNVSIKGKGVANQGKELRPLLLLGVVAIEKGAFWLHSTTVTNFTFFLTINKTSFNTVINILNIFNN